MLVGDYANSQDLEFQRDLSKIPRIAEAILGGVSCQSGKVMRRGVYRGKQSSKKGIDLRKTMRIEKKKVLKN